MHSALTTPAIALDAVTKRYRRSAAGVFDLTFEVRPGEVFGFLGANGAGKTTTIRLIADLIRPQSGRIRVCGLDTRADSVAVRRHMGYIPGELALYERLTAGELLGHLAALRGGPSASEIAALAERLGLALDQPIRSLSKGNKQKVGLVQAFMGRPDVLVLDEPTTGLDPMSQQLIHQLLRERTEAGAAVLLSSHVLAEVAEVADRVGIIRDGRLVAVDEVGALVDHAPHRVRVRVDGPAPLEALVALPGVREPVVHGDELTLTLTGSVDPFVKVLAAHRVVDLEIRPPDLEEIFLSLYGRHEAGRDWEEAP